jgi:soluble lytic murein transglycosylase
MLRIFRLYPLVLSVMLVLLLARCARNQTTASPTTPVAVPTFTPTPAQGGVAILQPANPLAPSQGLPSTADEAPGVQAGNEPPSVEAAAAIDAPANDEAESPFPLTPTAVPAPTLPVSDRLAQGKTLHRYGDYTASRSEFAAVLNTPGGDDSTRLEARYELARSYLAEGAYGEALATLDQLDQEIAAATADPANFAAKDTFLRAEALMGQQQYGQAVALYWQFLESYPWMAEVVQARIAAAYRAAGDPTSATAAYRRAADATTETLARLRLLEEMAATHSAAGNYGEAVVVYDEILSSAQNAPYRAQMHYQAGQALASAGDLPGATERWLAATREAPENRSAYAALIELVNRNIPFDLYLRGYIDLKAAAYLPAINAYQAYLASVDATDSRYALALHGLGQSYLGAQNYAEALPLFDRVIVEFPACDCFGEAWLDKAAAQSGLGDSVGARRTYRTFAGEYPANALAAEALWRSGLQALREGNQIEAATDFLTLADAFPASERAPLGLYTVALGAVQAGLHSQAVDLLSRLQRDYPEYRWAAVGYWLGRAYQARGESAQAQAQWRTLVETAPDIYYGILAAYALRQQPLTGGSMMTTMKTIAGPATRLEGDDGSQAFAERWLNDWLQLSESSLSALPVEIAQDQDLRMARLLLELDQRGDALALFERVYTRNRDTPHALYALSLEFERLGVYRLSILSMARLLEFSPAQLVEDAPIFLQQRSYPRHFRTLIDREAAGHNLNPLLFYSLIRQESLFEEGARSSAAAQGLAQIIPDTGQWIAERLGHPDYTNDIIYRPHINLWFGAYYLDWARGYLDGNLVSALVGYNAGPGNSAAWRRTSGADDTLFVEVLTFNEPRLYIQLIASHLYHYTRLYG